MPDALKLLLTRRTIPANRLGEPGPNDEQVRSLIAAASRVPDHGKLAPWRFILYAGADRLAAGNQLFDLWKSRNPQADEKLLALVHERLVASPVVIAVVCHTTIHPKIPEWEQVLSAAASTMNLMLAAHAMGFAAQWLTDWYSYDQEALDLLGDREGEKVVGFIHVGTPMEPPSDRPRPSFEEVVTVWKAD